ncbi:MULTISPECIES: YueH family protein [Staphylococcus]|uniref:YueH family protein n=1 Tax=Staphylococcus TaxID=1279 RepID=UPI0002462F49|nr:MULTISPECIES: YueH family protein [Staphylococcus]KAB7647025.1 hypothetical protein F9280_02085 [Staphylococcus sp. B2-b]QAV31406.1 hypothetical protein SD1155_07415 [Sulfitobacter donghicola]MBN6852132.1 hypothetical protein [Staphylococcus warneri]MBT2769016.1 hypothetical protein [Staphylococcus warneri]MBX7839535.1 YueH family protein [Staphylococcus warneri]
MKIREYTEGTSVFQVYFHRLNETMLIAIPDQFWSVEVAIDLNVAEINEALLMQFFTFYDEEEAQKLANVVTYWFETILKEND